MLAFWLQVLALKTDTAEACQGPLLLAVCSALILVSLYSGKNGAI